LFPDLYINMNWIVLLIILILIIAAIWYLSSANLDLIKKTPIAGAGESLSQIQREVLDIIEPNIKEYGTSQITEHLHKFYDYTKSQISELKSIMKKSDINLKPSGLKYLALLIQDIADRNSIVDPYEFIEDSGISGASFMRPALKTRVISSVQPYSSTQLASIKDLIKDIIREKNLSADADSLLKRIESIRMYTMHKKRLEPDLLALRPIIITMAKQQPQKLSSEKEDLDRLIEKIKLLQLFKDYPSIRLDRITTLRDLLDRIRPLDPVSYMEGKKDAEKMFSSLADRDRELQRRNEKLQQELRDKELAERLQAEESQKAKQAAEAKQKEEDEKKAEEERVIRQEFDKILDDDLDLQQKIAENEFTREQLYEQFKRQWVGGYEQPNRDKIIKLINDILERNKQTK